MAIQTINIAFDPDLPSANAGHTALEAVTKDQLNINLTGQLQHALPAYLRNVRLDLYSNARRVVLNRKD